jgi:hypothetical protein
MHYLLATNFTSSQVRYPPTKPSSVDGINKSGHAAGINTPGPAAGVNKTGPAAGVNKAGSTAGINKTGLASGIKKSGPAVGTKKPSLTVGTSFFLLFIVVMWDQVYHSTITLQGDSSSLLRRDYFSELHLAAPASSCLQGDGSSSLFGDACTRPPDGVGARLLGGACARLFDAAFRHHFRPHISISVSLQQGDSSALNRDLSTLQNGLISLQEDFSTATRVPLHRSGWWPVWTFAIMELHQEMTTLTRIPDTKDLLCSHLHDRPKSQPGRPQSPQIAPAVP